MTREKPVKGGKRYLQKNIRLTVDYSIEVQPLSFQGGEAVLKIGFSAKHMSEE